MSFYQRTLAKKCLKLVASIAMLVASTTITANSYAKNTGTSLELPDRNSNLSTPNKQVFNVLTDAGTKRAVTATNSDTCRPRIHGHGSLVGQAPTNQIELSVYVEDGILSKTDVGKSKICPFEHMLSILNDSFGKLPSRITIFVGKIPSSSRGYVENTNDSIVYVDYATLGGITKTVNNGGVAIGVPSIRTYPEVIAHEIQHLINRRTSDIWLNEALSEAAAHWVNWLSFPKPQPIVISNSKSNPNVFTHQIYYLDSTHQGNMSGYSGMTTYHSAYWKATDRFTRDVTDFRGDGVSYAKSYLFLQYLRTQVNRINGNRSVESGKIKLYREIIEQDRTKSSIDAVQYVINKYIDPSLSFAQFKADFEKTLQVTDEFGKFSFNGERFFLNSYRTKSNCEPVTICR